MATKRLLVMDDDEGIRELMQFCLEIMAGWQVLTAASGQEGITKAQLEQPDAIILDLVMPELDGWETLRQLQTNQSTQHIPIILLTAQDTYSETDYLQNLGIIGVIAKPFKPTELGTHIQELLQWEKC